MKVVVIAIALFCMVASVASKPDRLVCYLGTWATYRPGNGKFEVEDLDPFICTHAIYAFIGLEPSVTGEIKVLDPWNDLPDGGGKDGLRRFNDMKKINPKLKTMVSIGGWKEKGQKFSEVFDDSAKRAVFVRSVMNFLAKHRFDGLDINWQYPYQSNDTMNFVKILSELKAEFINYGYILSASVHAAERTFRLLYDIPRMSLYLDFFNVMTYDFHVPNEKHLDLHTPLYSGGDHFNVNESIQAWLRYGAPPQKLNMGIAFYGRSFTKKSVDCNTPRICEAIDAGNIGSLTVEGGLLGYHEICLTEPTATKVFDDDRKVPYMYWSNQWVGYDDLNSAKLKVDYIKEFNLGGAMVWSVDYDDFRGHCGKGKSPMLTLLNKELVA
ncbi:chitotriosidase-1-like [Arctopsyche grandis]|uniref:chitotriosidase-1-like n=1 Tax=Arctopsyche grandis TaxID=121162 RepID=UPI00406D8485